VESPPEEFTPEPEFPPPPVDEFSAEIDDSMEYDPPPPISTSPDSPLGPDSQPEEGSPIQAPEPAPAQTEGAGPLSLEEDATYLVTVIIKNQGDSMRDKLRLRQVYGTLISYPGKDRFAFQIIENDAAHLLEFPNASTKVSKELIHQLRDLLGRENVQVEKYLL
jgi:hypothetical protein